jgi:P-type Ca2+ transporter type 2C
LKQLLSSGLIENDRVGALKKDKPMQQWHTQEVDAVAVELRTDPVRGLVDEEVALRLEKYGPNELTGTGRKTPAEHPVRAVHEHMVLILIAAAVAFRVFGKEPSKPLPLRQSSFYLLSLGFFQEYRAERAMAALRKMTVPVVRVRRGGRVIERSARELVPGDIILLEAGNLVPADLRLLESVNLRTQEAALTGESEPVEKITAALKTADLPLGDRRNMAYMGTLVSYGRGGALSFRPVWTPSWARSPRTFRALGAS